MGIFEKIFGKSRKQYPELDGSDPAAKKLDVVRNSLEDLSAKVNDPMEVVPADDSAYVFIGNPPRNFGMAWIENDREHNFKTLAKEREISQRQMMEMVEKLAAAYRKSESAERYMTTIAGKQVTVTPSSELAGKVQSIIANA